MINIKIPIKLQDLLYKNFEKIAVIFRFIADDYVDIHNGLVGNEIKLLDIKKDEVVLHIGCGAIPGTALTITKKTGAKVIGIDKDAKAVKKASNYITKLGLNNKVQIKHVNNLDFPLNEFDVIIISRGVYERNEILKYISKNSKKNVRIIIRVPDSFDKFKIKKILRNTCFKKLDSCNKRAPTVSLELSKKRLIKIY